MNRIFLDFKKLILGQDGTENMPLDFKEEITVSIKNSLIDKAKATLLMTARNNADKLGKQIDKQQIADVSGKGERVKKEEVEKIAEEEHQNIKRAKAKKEEEKEEEKKRKESLRQTMQRIAQQDEKAENNINYRQKRRLIIIKTCCEMKKITTCFVLN